MPQPLHVLPSWAGLQVRDFASQAPQKPQLSASGRQAPAWQTPHRPQAAPFAWPAQSRPRATPVSEPSTVVSTVAPTAATAEARMRRRVRRLANQRVS
jgi:hypothetical protein